MFNEQIKSKIKRILDLAIEFYTLSFLCLTLLNTLFLVELRHYKFLEGFIESFLVLNVGVRGLLAFIANTYTPVAHIIAKKYNWPISCSLQREVAASEGAFGLLGLLSLWFHGNFWLAVIVGYSFSWITSEIVGIYKIIREYFFNGKLKCSWTILLGMCLDLIITLFVLIIALFIL